MFIAAHTVIHKAQATKIIIQKHEPCNANMVATCMSKSHNLSCFKGVEE